MTKENQRVFWWFVLVIMVVAIHVATWHWWALLSFPLSVVVGIYFAWLIKD